MNFLAPGAFFLGLLLPIIIALYLLKLRRVEREVPSTYLWRKMIRDVEANAPWQKLRPNLLMILQLLFMAVLIFALARPFRWVEGAGGEAAILILDTSASMAATDVSPSRIESAKERARQLVDDLPGTSKVTIIEAGNEARVLLSSSLDRRQAHLAIDQAHAGTGSSDIGIALELASAIASRQPGTEIIVLSDGQVNIPEHLVIKGALRYIPFGLNGENQAISLFTLEPEPGGASLTAFVQVSNYGENPASRRLTLSSGGQVLNVFDLADIPAGGQKNAIAEGLPLYIGELEAQLDGVDTLALDDHAVAILPETDPVQVTLVTSGNLFLRTALALLPGVALTEQEAAVPESIEPTPAAGAPTPTAAPTRTAAPVEDSDTSAPGLIIYDNTVPDALPASGSLLFIAPPRSTDLFTTTGLEQSPVARIIDPLDPLASNISLDDVSILDAVRVPLPDWATPVVAGDLPTENIPLIFRGEVNGQRIAVITFDLRHSDLPLQVAFPLLLSNTVDWLAPGARSQVPVQVIPGESLAFNAPKDAPSATIIRPDGSTIQARAENGRYVFTDTTQLGAYQITFHTDTSSGDSGETASFAVNLFSPEESDLKPADNLPGLETQSDQAGAGTNLSRREWWRPLALLALGLLVGEWFVYQRAALARLRDMFLRIPGARPKRYPKGS